MTEDATTKTPLTYTVISGAPIVVNVVEGGERQTLRVGLVILDVRATGRFAENGLPVYELDASISVNPVKT